jgi:3-hydroxymyristoyl/3-hydroxydecanoyl-(acyl carrier protein) dehydratase
VNHDYFGLSAQSIIAFATSSLSTVAEQSNFQIPFLLVITFKCKMSLSPGIAGLLKVITNKKGIWKFDCSATVDSELVAKAMILCADRPK